MRCLRFKFKLQDLSLVSAIEGLRPPNSKLFSYLRMCLRVYMFCPNVDKWVLNVGDHAPQQMFFLKSAIQRLFQTKFGSLLR